MRRLHQGLSGRGHQFCPISHGHRPGLWGDHSRPGASGSGPGFSGYEHPDVVTSVEFERLLSATGPHRGKLRRPSDGTLPENIAFIQCVGSRDSPGRRLLLHRVLPNQPQGSPGGPGTQRPGVASTVFYMDLRAQGKGDERYLEQARDARSVWSAPG